MDFNPDGYTSSFTSLDQANVHYQPDVGADSKIRTDFGIGPKEACVASFFKSTQYDRLSGTNIESFPGSVEIWASGVKKGEIVINSPLTQRYFSEPELVDCAREAGFSEFMFLRVTNPGAKYIKLPTQFSIDDTISEDNIGLLMANNLLCINT